MTREVKIFSRCELSPDGHANIEFKKIYSTWIFLPFCQIWTKMNYFIRQFSLVVVNVNFKEWALNTTTGQAQQDRLKAGINQNESESRWQGMWV